VESIDRELLPQMQEIVKKIEGVEDTSLVLQSQVFAKFNNYIQPLIVKGIDFRNDGEKKLFYQYVKNDTLNDGFFVGEGLKDRFYLVDKIEYYPIEKTLKLKESKIRGFFRVGIYDIDNNFLIADLEKAKNLSPTYLLFLGVRIKNPFEADKVKDKIRERFTQGVFVNTWMESNQVLFSALKLEKIAMFVILSLIILVASFNIFATLTVKVVEKTKDIGILKALGFTSRRILSTFSLQGLLLGFIGVFFGSLFGLSLCVALQNYPFKILPEEIYYIEYLPVAINYRDIFLIAILGVVLSFISSLFPAIRASRLSCCEALRYE
jgi:lipoprotein-releasing system permease protein